MPLGRAPFPLEEGSLSMTEARWLNHSDKVRFHKSIGLPDANGCMRWISHFNNCGYGRFCIAYRQILAHRFAYQVWVAAIPEGLTLDHLCGHPWRVAPDHLEPTTHRTNILRGSGRAAINAAKTHCMRGHAFDEANTRTTTSGGRQCVQCRRAYMRQYRLAKRKKD